MGRPILADEHKVDIPVIRSIIVAKEYTVDLHTSSSVDCLNKNAMTCNESNEKAMGMNGEQIENYEDEGVEAYYLSLVV